MASRKTIGRSSSWSGTRVVIRQVFVFGVQNFPGYRPPRPRVGCEPSLPTLASPCVCATVRAVVLQKGTRFQQVSALTLVSANLAQLMKVILPYDSHRKQREAKIKREVKRGIREPNEQDPFEIFVTVTDIRYTYTGLRHTPFIVADFLSRYYKESHKILGNTYGMCILQDFEAITPNLLARTIETVEGGGLVILLLKTMASLRQLYTMTMVCICAPTHRIDVLIYLAGRPYEIPDFCS